MRSWNLGTSKSWKHCSKCCLSLYLILMAGDGIGMVINGTYSRASIVPQSSSLADEVSPSCSVVGSLAAVRKVTRSTVWSAKGPRASHTGSDKCLAKTTAASSKTLSRLQEILSINTSITGPQEQHVLHGSQVIRSSSGSDLGGCGEMEWHSSTTSLKVTTFL
jgi:hypothetical protein